MSGSPTHQETTIKPVPQLGILTTLLMFAWPALWFTFIIYVVAHQFTPAGGSTRNLDMVRSIGADQVIDYTQEDFTQTEQGYELILATAGFRSIYDY